jgi:hypothetical protein
VMGTKRPNSIIDVVVPTYSGLDKHANEKKVLSPQSSFFNGGRTTKSSRRPPSELDYVNVKNLLSPHKHS